MRRERRAGFTLLEILLAMAILAMVSAVTYLTFSTVVTAWQRGLALTNSLHHGDFLIEQLAMALRSTYYESTKHGFVMEDNGDGEYASDEISWVKVGASLVGRSWASAESPHRTSFWIEDESDGKRAVVRAWQLAGQVVDFDPEDVPLIHLSQADVITGFNCRTADEKPADEDEIEWLDEWEETNRVPQLVEITLYVQPRDPNMESVEIKRLIQIRALKGQPGAKKPPRPR